MSAAPDWSKLLPMLPGPIHAMLLTPLFIGFFIKEWGALERAMARVIALHLELNRVEYLERFLDLNADQQLKALAGALGDTPAAVEIVARANRLVLVRNDVVHGYWGSINESDDFVVYRKKRKIAGFTEMPMSINDVMGAVSDVQRLACDLFEFKR